MPYVITYLSILSIFYTLIVRSRVLIEMCVFQQECFLVGAAVYFLPLHIVKPRCLVASP